MPAPSASRRQRRPSERCDNIVLTPAPRFWAKAEALVAQEEFLTWGQFQWHYRAQLASQLLGYQYFLYHSIELIL